MTSIPPCGASKCRASRLHLREWRQWPSQGKGQDMTNNIHSRSKKLMNHTFLQCFKEIETLPLFSPFCERSFFHWPCHSVVSWGLLGLLSWAYSVVWGPDGSTENTYIWRLEVWESLGRLFLFLGVWLNCNLGTNPHSQLRILHWLSISVCISLHNALATICLLSTLPKTTGQVEYCPCLGRTKLVCKGLF